jgi:hypothetical protein
MVPRAGQLSVTRTVLFVCPHGAGMSRVAAAWFNTTPPAGWRVTSAGIGPQAELGTNAPRLLAGTPPAEGQLDRHPRRSVGSVPACAQTIAICCDVPGAERWELRQHDFTRGMQDEIRGRVNSLVAQLTLEGARP